MAYELIQAPNFILPDSGIAGMDPNLRAQAYQQATSNPGLLKGLLGGGIGSIGTLYGKLRNGIAIPNLKEVYGKLNSGYQTAIGDPNAQIWSKATGLDGLGNYANLGGGIYHTAKAIGNVNGLVAANNDLNSLMSDVKNEAYTNPMLSSYLDANQKKLLRQVQNGSYSSNNTAEALGGAVSGVGGSIPDILKNAALGLATGGTTGALIQGLGTAVNKGIQGATNAKNSRTERLQALYDQLAEANRDYNSMKRPSNIRYAGLSSKAYNGLY